jgi:hypothetical protein
VWSLFEPLQEYQESGLRFSVWGIAVVFAIIFVLSFLRLSSGETQLPRIHFAAISSESWRSCAGYGFGLLVTIQSFYWFEHWRTGAEQPVISIQQIVEIFLIVVTARVALDLLVPLKAFAKAFFGFGSTTQIKAS